MQINRVPLGRACRLYSDILNGNIGVVGEVPKIIMRRLSDSKYWNDSNSTWQEAVYENVLPAIDGTNMPGLYGYVFTIWEDMIVRCKNTGTYAFDEYSAWLLV